MILNLDEYLFNPKFHIFLSSDMRSALGVSWLDRLIFLLNEIAHVATDAASDTFTWTWSVLKENPNNVAFGLYIVLMFRMVCGGFLISVAWKAIKYSPIIANREPEYLIKLKVWLEEAKARGDDCDALGATCDIEKRPPIFDNRNARTE